MSEQGKAWIEPADGAVVVEVVEPDRSGGLVIIPLGDRPNLDHNQRFGKVLLVGRGTIITEALGVAGVLDRIWDAAKRIWDWDAPEVPRKPAPCQPGDVVVLGKALFIRPNGDSEPAQAMVPFEAVLGKVHGLRLVDRSSAAEPEPEAKAEPSAENVILEP